MIGVATWSPASSTPSVTKTCCTVPGTRSITVTLTRPALAVRTRFTRSSGSISSVTSTTSGDQGVPSKAIIRVRGASTLGNTRV
jgi:hypothetical protein